MIRVLIVEDQAILRESLARSVGDQPDMTVVSAIADASEALGVALKERPDMILMDVCTEHDSNGIVAAARIKEQLPECRIIIMTGMPEITFVDQAREAGVDSFVYKNVGIDELFAVMRSTLAGYCTFPKPPESIFSGTATLDDVELSILRLACEGKSRREIAAELFMSEGTIKRRISEILNKTGYDNIMRLACARICPPIRGYRCLPLRDGCAVRGDVLVGIGQVGVDADGRVDQVVKAVKLAAREREFLGGAGAGHQVSREPGFLHSAVDVGLAGRSVEGQVLVALVGDVDDKADVAPVVLELLGDGDGAQIVIGDGDGGGDFDTLDVVVFDGLIDLFFLLGRLAILLHRAGQILVGLGEDKLVAFHLKDELVVLELQVVRLIFGGDRYGGGVLGLPFQVGDLKEHIEDACAVLVEDQDAVEAPLLEHIHVLIGELFAIQGSTRVLPAADEVGLGVFAAAAAARQGKGERQDACQKCEYGLFERCLHGVLLLV